MYDDYQREYDTVVKWREELAKLRAQRDRLRAALSELASRAEWLMHYADTGATVTTWTDKQTLAEPGSKANHGALRDAYDKARAALKECEQ